MIDDTELLRSFAEEKSEAAFAELVRRRLNLVYSVALRQCGGDAHRAEDAAQKVFIDLARKAHLLARQPVLLGWLYRSAQCAAIDLVRSEARRHAREAVALAMNEASAAAGPNWSELRPFIDEAMAELGERDRDALLLRYVEAEPFAQIGARLGLTEDAARRRVDRALEKIRGRLARRGIRSTAALLAGAFAAQAGTAAPAGVAGSITSAALTHAAANGATLGGFAAIFTMAKTKSFIAGGLLLVGAATLVFEARGNRALRAELSAARGAADALPSLEREQRRLAAQLGEEASGNPDVDELARLRRSIQELNTRPPGVYGPAMAPVAPLGRGTPDAAFVSFLDAVGRGDLEAVGQMMVFSDTDAELTAAFERNFSPTVRGRYRTPGRLFAAAMFHLRDGVRHPDPAATFQVIGINDRPDGDRRVKLWVRSVSGRELEVVDVFRRTAAGWASAGPWPFADPRTIAAINERIDPATGDLRPASQSLRK